MAQNLFMTIHLAIRLSIYGLLSDSYLLNSINTYAWIGPIYMTYPTAAIAPILLEDMRKVMVERKNETNFFTSNDIKNCMSKVTAVDLHQVIQVDPEIQIKAYYAGHVLGAALFHIKVTDMLGSSETCGTSLSCRFAYTVSIVYTGDYNMTPDRHLGYSISFYTINNIVLHGSMSANLIYSLQNQLMPRQ